MGDMEEKSILSLKKWCNSTVPHQHFIVLGRGLSRITQFHSYHGDCAEDSRIVPKNKALKGTDVFLPWL